MKKKNVRPKGIKFPGLGVRIMLPVYTLSYHVKTGARLQKYMSSLDSEKKGTCRKTENDNIYEVNQASHRNKELVQKISKEKVVF